MSPNIKELLDKISSIRHEDELTCVAELIKHTNNINYNHEAVCKIAKSYIENFRKNTGNVGLEEFFRQYGLDTNEGVAVMSLAEALLRISDVHTANLFIHDKLLSADWSQAKKSASSIVKASSLGLKIAGKVLELGKAVSTVADPVIRKSIKQSIRLVGNHFVLAETINNAVKKAKKYESEGYLLSYDMLGEGARSEEQAKKYLQSYLRSVREVAVLTDKTKSLYKRPGISVKLSALYPKYKLLNKAQVFDNLLPRLKEICLWAKASEISVIIDAEESSRLDVSMELFEKLISDKDLSGFNGVGIAVQAYNKSAPYVVDLICEIGRQNNRRIPLRLVKGAYWDSEIKAAQMAGIVTYPVYTCKEYSDLSYLVCAHKMLQNPDFIYPQFATHNALTIASIEVMATNGQDYEFQRLYGMGKGIYDQVISRVPCRIYAPVGAYEELLPYLIRRILENAANTSFIKKVVDNDVTIEELLESPIEKAIHNLETQFNARPRIPLPLNLYGTDRKNSIGFDLGNNIHIEMLKREIIKFQDKSGKTSPIINGKECGKLAHLVEDECTSILAPYDTNIIVGTVVTSNLDNIKASIASVSEGFKGWSGKAVSARAAIIQKFADLLEENCYELMALCIMEAGKTIGDSIAELREAVDFCRYYAARAIELFSSPKILHGPTGELNELTMHGRGVFLCISPWNFPLAIFIGQVVAALVAGNTVIAKPAEQTPLIAAFAVKLLLKAGLPKDSISFLPGEGTVIGGVLLSDKRIAGVAFTGSNETANIIAKSLAMRSTIIPFIAETGGINAMIIDSSAHIEQAIDDIMLSAYGSAGQRCSALRVLYVQEEIADMAIDTLKGAMEILNLGKPIDFSVDIGPVIDGNAYDALSDYIKSAKEKFKVLYQYKTELPDNLKNGYFISPIAFEINSIFDLPGEVFGPVLHVIRFKADNFEQIIADINNCGYGLTVGLQTRISSRIQYLRRNIRVGNMYINRSMIGATVGVQPFGGEGLSGTGPKAGGPNYLLRFVTERTFTENTAAIGGNRELLTF